MTIKVYKKYKRNHVLIGKGRGVYNHPATARLRRRIKETILLYEEADRDVQKAIAAQIVDEFLAHNGAFVKASDGQSLTRDDAIANVRNRFAQVKTKPPPNDDDSFGEEYAILAMVNEEAKAVNAVLEDDFGAADILSKPTRAAGDFNVDSFLSELGCYNGGKRKQPLSFIKEELLEQLSGDSGDAMATCLLTILNLSANNEKEDSDATKEAFRALASCKPNKRHKHQVDDEGTVTTANLTKEANSQITSSKPRASSSKDTANEKQSDSDMESVTDSFAAVTIKTEYIRDLDIVSRLPIGKDRIYSGAVRIEETENGTKIEAKKIPHGVGFMTYRKSNRWSCGHWRDGKLHGLAAKTYDLLDENGNRTENGHRCIGIFSKNGLHGKAAYLTNTWSFLGRFNRNKRNGKGILKHMPNGTYEGTFFGDTFVTGIHTEHGKGAKHVLNICLAKELV